MLNALRIELLKSRRTKSFFITMALMIVALAWNLVSLGEELHSIEYDTLGVLFNNQTINSFFLPIAVSIFTSKIVSNEIMGQTFKLQNANGTTTLQIFTSKMILASLFFLLISVLQTGVTSLFASMNGIQVPMQVKLIQCLGQFLASFTLICIYLSLAMFIERQGVLLSLGFIGGFFGLILASKSTSFLIFLFPWVGVPYLSPYKFTLIDATTYNYFLDQLILFKLVIYFFYALLIYFLVRQIIRKKVTY